MLLEVDGRQAYAYTGTHRPIDGQDTLVFVHGAGMDHSVWILQSRYFAFHHCNVLAVDLPGHGRSAGSPLASIEDMADWLAALLQAVGVSRAALVGHSMGSLAVLEAAARHGDRVSRLALLGAAAPMPVAQMLLQAAASDQSAAAEMITGWAHSPASQLGGNRAPGLWMAGGGRRLLEKSAAGVLHTDLLACNTYQNGLTSAAKVSCPVLVLIGQRDMMTPGRAAKELIAALARVRAVELAGCGHMMCYERPEETLDALIDFLLQ